jgi:hypothetical protein
VEHLAAAQVRQGQESLGKVMLGALKVLLAEVKILEAVVARVL